MPTSSPFYSTGIAFTQRARPACTDSCSTRPGMSHARRSPCLRLQRGDRGGAPGRRWKDGSHCFGIVKRCYHRRLCFVRSVCEPFGHAQRRQKNRKVGKPNRIRASHFCQQGRWEVLRTRRITEPSTLQNGGPHIFIGSRQRMVKVVLDIENRSFSVWTFMKQESRVAVYFELQKEEQQFKFVETCYTTGTQNKLSSDQTLTEVSYRWTEKKGNIRRCQKKRHPNYHLRVWW